VGGGNTSMSGGPGALGGSSDERGDVDDPDATASGAAGRQIQAVGRVIDEARRHIRDGTVDEELLKDLGMDAREFRDFVKRYADRLDLLPAARERGVGEPGRLAEVGLPGSLRLQSGRAVDGGVEVGGGEKLSPDAVRELYGSRLKKVSPEYRDAVEAYFRTVSEMETRRATTAPAP
jgi:hypothetical protein